MPVNPPVPQAPGFYVAQDIIVDAMIEINMLSPAEASNLDGDIMQWGLRKLNYMLDVWAAQRMYVPYHIFQTFNLQAGLSPHTIGPNNATFIVNQVPVKIESWALVINSNVGATAVDLPHRPLRDKDWWAMQRVKSLQSNIPTDLYYEPTNPNGSLFFWPVPNAVYPVRLELWGLLSQYSGINDPIDGPGGTGIVNPAYRAAMMLTLAEFLQPGAAKAGNPNLSLMAAKARAAVFSENIESPSTSTKDFGMQVRRRSADFNWETGNLT